jgi:hypothetical protein
VTDPRRPWARRAAGIGLLVPTLAFPTSVSAPSSGSILIQDPYARGRGSWYVGQVHMHSNTHKSGVSPDSTREKVEKYRDAGFDFVCVTDHNFELLGEGRAYAVLPTRDPGVEGIHFISGAEVGFQVLTPDGSPRWHHFGGVGMDWTVQRGDSLFRLAETDLGTAAGTIDSIRTMRYTEKKEALAILNHPEMVGLGDTRIFPSDIRPLTGQAGIEVFNTKWSNARPGGKSWQRHGASHWDFLIQLGSGMRWGFATDDAHHYRVGMDYLGGWILVQSEELTTEAILDAVKEGCFVACVDSCSGATRDTTSAVFSELGARAAGIVAASDRPTEFTWWADYGHMVRRTEGSFADTFRVEGWERYVRVRIRNDAGAAYSQPFFVENPARDEDRWQLRKERDTRMLFHFNEGSGPVVEDALGGGDHLLLSQPSIPPVAEWLTLADTVAYRDSLWGGWIHNSTGTTPDETDLDRDRWGYALNAHGRSLRGEVPVSERSPFLIEGEVTIEWIGAVTGRTGEEQPILVNEEERGREGARRGWRVVVAPRSATESYRFRCYESGETGQALTIPFGEGIEPSEQHLFALICAERGGKTEIRVFVDGREVARASRSAELAWRTSRTAASTPFLVFADPFREDTSVYYRLRELRLTAAARKDEEILEDAARTGFHRDAAPTPRGGTPGSR